jgi:hypothetical protein
MANKDKKHTNKKMVPKTIQQPKKRAEVEDNLKLRRQLKNASYKSSLSSVRKNLPKRKQRLFSGLIHAPGMDNSNDILARTIARPKSIIGGSIVAVVGTVASVYLSKYYEYSYNYLLLFLFFVLGYAVELVFESVIKFFVRYKD